MRVSLTLIPLRSEQSGLHQSKMKAALFGLLNFNCCPLTFALSFDELLKALRVWRACDAAVCDDCGDECVGRHVEGWVVDGDAFGGKALLAYVCDFACVALFDGYLFARGHGEVDG